jgi:hypothetical protein
MTCIGDRVTRNQATAAAGPVEPSPRFRDIWIAPILFPAAEVLE